MNENKEKLDIEDIKGPEELDIEDAVSEEETDLKAGKEAEVEPVIEDTPEKIEQKQEIKKSKKSFFGRKKTEKKKKDKKAVENKTEEETSQKEENIIEKPTKKKGSFLKTFAIISLTMLVTATIVLGAGWWWLNKKTPEKQETVQETATEKPAETKEPVVAKKYVYVNVAEGLNLRKEPNVTAEILVIMPFGTKLEVLETQGDWIKTTYQDKTGWCMTGYTSQTSPLIYKNSDYGLSITFPETWSTYKLFPADPYGATAAYYVGLKTTDNSYNESNLEKGYVSLFAIDVYTKAQWTAAQNEEGIKPTFLTQNGQYVIAYSLPNGTRPTDIEARVAEVKSVLSTIKFE